MVVVKTLLFVIIEIHTKLWDISTVVWDWNHFTCLKWNTNKNFHMKNKMMTFNSKFFILYRKRRHFLLWYFQLMSSIFEWKISFYTTSTYKWKLLCRHNTTVVFAECPQKCNISFFFNKTFCKSKHPFYYFPFHYSLDIHVWLFMLLHLDVILLKIIVPRLQLWSRML